MQDDLDEHVDVTNSRLQVCFLVFTWLFLMIGINMELTRGETMDFLGLLNCVKELYLSHLLIIYSDLCVLTSKVPELYLMLMLLFVQQTVQRKLALLNKRTKGGCSCLILLVIAIVILIVVIRGLFKYL
jgi:hypothetical protein